LIIHGRKGNYHKNMYKICTRNVKEYFFHGKYMEETLTMSHGHRNFIIFSVNGRVTVLMTSGQEFNYGIPLSSQFTNESSKK
jgi:hypothetical protein